MDGLEKTYGDLPKMEILGSLPTLNTCSYPILRVETSVVITATDGGNHSLHQNRATPQLFFDLWLVTDYILSEGIRSILQ